MRSSISCGVSTAVGLVEHRGRQHVAQQRLQDLDAAAGRRPVGPPQERPGSTFEPVPFGEVPGPRLAGRLARRRAKLAQRSCSLTQHHVLGHREHRDQHEVLVHHSDAGTFASPGPANLRGGTVEQDLAARRAGSGHRGCSSGVDLPAPFSPRRAWTLAQAIPGQIDRIVATSSSPKRLVIPRNSSIRLRLLDRPGVRLEDLVVTGNPCGAAPVVNQRGAATRARFMVFGYDALLRRRRLRLQLDLDRPGDRCPCLDLLVDLAPSGSGRTLVAKSWNSDRPVPFCGVPT